MEGRCNDLRSKKHLLALGSKRLTKSGIRFHGRQNDYLAKTCAQKYANACIGAMGPTHTPSPCAHLFGFLNNRVCIAAARSAACSGRERVRHVQTVMVTAGGAWGEEGDGGGGDAGTRAGEHARGTVPRLRNSSSCTKKFVWPLQKAWMSTIIGRQQTISSKTL